MANPVQALNENFFYNSMLARALLQLLPEEDRNLARAWLDKLHVMDNSHDEMINRNDYMWFLLLVLQSKKLSLPFTRLPPQGELKPLRSILRFQPPNVYENVLTSTDQTFSWVEQIAENKESDDKFEPEPKEMSCPPSEFLSNQPMPKDGIICYMACFGDHDY